MGTTATRTNNKSYGMNRTDRVMLVLKTAHKGMTASEIAERTGLSPDQVSVVLRRKLADGAVYRRPCFSFHVFKAELEEKEKPFTVYQQSILDTLKKGDLTSDAVADVLGNQVSSVRNALWRLKRMRRIHITRWLNHKGRIVAIYRYGEGEDSKDVDFHTPTDNQMAILSVLKDSDGLAIGGIAAKTSVVYGSLSKILAEMKRQKLIYVSEYRFIKHKCSLHLSAIYRAGAGENAVRPEFGSDEYERLLQAAKEERLKPEPRPKLAPIPEPTPKPVPKPIPKPEPEKPKMTIRRIFTGDVKKEERPLTEVEKQNADIGSLWDAATKVAVNMRKHGKAARVGGERE